MFVEHAIKLANNGYTDQAIDHIYDAVDMTFNNGEFDKLNNILLEIKPDIVSTDLLLTILTSTLSAKNKLPARKDLFDKIGSVLIDRLRSIVVPQLLKGLE